MAIAKFLFALLVAYFAIEGLTHIFRLRYSRWLMKQLEPQERLIMAKWLSAMHTDFLLGKTRPWEYYKTRADQDIANKRSKK